MSKDNGDRMYYHCCGCNVIYGDKERRHAIVKLKTNGLPRVITNCFNVTSGLCKKCELTLRNRFREIKKDLYTSDLNGK